MTTTVNFAGKTGTIVEVKTGEWQIATPVPSTVVFKSLTVAVEMLEDTLAMLNVCEGGPELRLPEALCD